MLMFCRSAFGFEFWKLKLTVLDLSFGFQVDSFEVDMCILNLSFGFQVEGVLQSIILAFLVVIGFAFLESAILSKHTLLLPALHQ